MSRREHTPNGAKAWRRRRQQTRGERGSRPSNYSCAIWLYVVWPALKKVEPVSHLHAKSSESVRQ